MKAMILAAGEGRRMRPLTLQTPKPLLQVKGKPLIEHHIERLRDARIFDIVVNVAYLGEKIQNALGTGERLGVKIEYSYEPEPLETAGAIRHALPLLGDQPFLLVNGDVWTDYPFEHLSVRAQRLFSQSSSLLAHLVLVANPTHKVTGDFVLSNENLIAARHETMGLTFSGLSIMSPELIRQYPQARQKFPLLEVFLWAIEQKRMSGEKYDGVWCDVGTPERLAELND